MWEMLRQVYDLVDNDVVAQIWASTWPHLIIQLQLFERQQLSETTHLCIILRQNLVGAPLVGHVSLLLVPRTPSVS